MNHLHIVSIDDDDCDLNEIDYINYNEDYSLDIMFRSIEVAESYNSMLYDLVIPQQQQQNQQQQLHLMLHLDTFVKSPMSIQLKCPYINFNMNCSQMILKYTSSEVCIEMISEFLNRCSEIDFSYCKNDFMVYHIKYIKFLYFKI